MKLSTSDGLELAGYAWPASEAKAAVVLIHGYAEHGQRYAHVAEAFVAEGMSCYGVDLRGHGHSPGARGFVDVFEDFHRDVEATLDWARSENPGLPLVLFGHSLGGLIAMHYMIKHPETDVVSLVISSPFLAVGLPVPAIKEAAGRLMSKILPKISLPSGLESDDLMRDPEFRKAHAADPLIFPTANARWYTEATRAQQEVRDNASQLSLPTLLLYGGEDKVADPNVTDTVAPKLPNAECERLAGHYHEIVNEAPAERELVLSRMSAWIKKTAVPAA